MGASVISGTEASAALEDPGCAPGAAGITEASGAACTSSVARDCPSPTGPVARPARWSRCMVCACESTMRCAFMLASSLPNSRVIPESTECVTMLGETEASSDSKAWLAHRPCA